MKTEMMNELKSLHEKMDRVLLLLEGKKKLKIPKPKPIPLTQEEIDKYKEQFGMLYEKWLLGEELEVSSTFDTFNTDDIRRFADANNLNVTSKMAKEKILTLIAARFREKKQLGR